MAKKMNVAELRKINNGNAINKKKYEDSVNNGKAINAKLVAKMLPKKK